VGEEVWGGGEGPQESYLLQPKGDKVQHGGELAEHDGLAAGVALQHALQLLSDRLDLGAAAEVQQAHPVDEAALLAARHAGGGRLHLTSRFRKKEIGAVLQLLRGALGRFR